jgi:multidrug resistance efflux pump
VTLANISELEEALAMAQDQVDASQALAEVEEVRDKLHAQLEQAARQLARTSSELEEAQVRGGGEGDMGRIIKGGLCKGGVLPWTVVCLQGTSLPAQLC